ncbi:MAG: hypothetical protein RR655_01040 [Raoultibacter sp.]
MAEEENKHAESKQQQPAGLAEKHTEPAKPAEPAKKEAAALPGEEEREEKKKFRWAEAQSWQKRRLFGSLAAIIAFFGIFLILTCTALYSDKASEDDYWNKYMSESVESQDEVAQYSQDATHVLVGTYLENVKAIDVKNSQFEVGMDVWYRWEGNPELDFTTTDAVHFYKGSVKKTNVLNDYHEGNTHYQQVRYDVVINKQYWTPRFPLESHQLRIYLEPSATVNDVVFDVDAENSYANHNLGISGFKMTRFGVAPAVVVYDNTNSNPEFDSFSDPRTYKTELMTQFEINREDIGLYFKCFIAMYGTTAWILLCLYICTNRRVDPLGMIGSAFFGAVSNIMIGANLVPDALKFGLLEYGNLFGVAIIIAGTAIVIGINYIRHERKDMAFAQFYGRIMLAVFVTIVVVGNLALPLSAMMF